MYATKEAFRQYLTGPARRFMSFQQYLIFMTLEGTMDQQMQQAHQAVHDIEQWQRSRESIAQVSACMLLLQLAVHLEQRAALPMVAA